MDVDWRAQPASQDPEGLNHTFVDHEFADVEMGAIGQIVAK